MTSQEEHVLGQHRNHDAPTTQREEGGAVVQLREEELAARTKQVRAGRVVLGTEVVAEEQTLEVPVSREEVTVERHPVARRPSDEPIAASSEEVIRVPVREEHVSLDKQPVVYEEVSVGKRTVQDKQRVADTVRKEVVDVDATGDIDVHGDADRRR
jgi:uncharacterized protein (TIGR02271 family)